jgi:hypothetical protein
LTRRLGGSPQVAPSTGWHRSTSAVRRAGDPERMRLPSVLAGDDLSPAELQAARLDGEVYDLAGAFCLIGELEGPVHRARAVLGCRSSRLIAELGTAAWVWGVAPHPARLEFAVTPDARARLAPREHAAVREIVFEGADLVDLDGCRVTSPLRTVVDLARSPAAFDPALVRRRCAAAGVARDDVLHLLAERSGIPGKRLAERRLSEALTP